MELVKEICTDDGITSTTDNEVCPVSWNSDKVTDNLEEMLVRNRRKQYNNSLKNNSLPNSTGEIIYGLHPSIKGQIEEKNKLISVAKKLSAAIEHNVQMRDYLNDAEYIILNIIQKLPKVELEKTFIQHEKTYKNKTDFHNFSAPYFKDKKYISSASYVKEDVPPSECSEDSMISYQIDIYDIYNAINVSYTKCFNGNGVKKTYKRVKNKVNNNSEYNESDFCSMESQFNSFLKILDKRENVYSIPPDKQINWYQVSSLVALEPSECEKSWKMIIKPLLLLGEWSDWESEQVFRIAKQYDYQNWDSIVKELGTGRSGYLCFCHINSKPRQGVICNFGAWIKREDDLLLKLIKKCSYGNAIIWGRIIYHFEDRTISQILNRWYRLNPSLKRGKFTNTEDNMLMYCVEQFGRDFGKIAALFGNRSPIQLRERYFSVKDMIEENKFGEWSIEEDKLLLDLIKIFGESNWAVIAAEFPGRNRIQIRHRYTYVLKRWIAKCPTLGLDKLKRHKRTTHIKSLNRLKQIDMSDDGVREFIENKLKTGKATLKRTN